MFMLLICMDILACTTESEPIHTDFGGFHMETDLCGFLIVGVGADTVQ